MTGKLMTLDEAVKVYGPEILDFLEKTQVRGLGTGAMVTRPNLPDGIYAIRPRPASGFGLSSVFGGLGQPGPFLNVVYQTIIASTVPTGQTGYLSEISFFSNKPLTTEFKVTIAGVLFVNAGKTQTSAGFIWRHNEGKGMKLNAGDVVKIEARNVADTVTVTGLITGTSER